MKKQPILMERNERAIEQLNHLLQRALPVFQAVVAAFANLNIGEFKADYFKHLISGHTGDFLRTLILKGAQAPKIAGIEIDHTSEAFRNMIKLPANSDDFFIAVEEMREVCKSNLSNSPATRINTEMFFTIANGEAVIDSTAADEHIKTLSMYAESDEEIELYEALSKIVNAIKQGEPVLAKHHKKPLEFTEHAGIKHNGLEFSVDGDFVKSTCKRFA